MNVELTVVDPVTASAEVVAAVPVALPKTKFPVKVVEERVAPVAVSTLLKFMEVEVALEGNG